MAQVETTNQKEVKPNVPGEIRVTSLGLVSSYVGYAKKLFDGGEPVITIRGTGKAMSNVVETAEILKRTYKGMHQVTALDTNDHMAEVSDEGKEPRRSVCFLNITLTLDASKIDKNAVGYQKPLTDEEMTDVDVDRLVQALKTAGIKRMSNAPRKPRPGMPARSPQRANNRSPQRAPARSPQRGNNRSPHRRPARSPQAAAGVAAAGVAAPAVAPAAVQAPPQNQSANGEVAKSDVI